MTWRREPDADRPAVDGVVVLDLEARIAFAERVWTDEGNDPAARAAARELAERARSAVALADCTFLGVVGDDGVEASADLFLRGELAQIEEVVTRPPFRGRGHASRLVRAAVARARDGHPDHGEGTRPCRRRQRHRAHAGSRRHA